MAETDTRGISVDLESPIRASIEQAGLLRDFFLTSLLSTGNNRVYRADAPGKTLLVKHYFQHPDDLRDRFAAEQAFYTFIRASGIRRTPEPIAWLPGEKLGLFEFIEGEKPQTSNPDIVKEALDFFQELNQHRLSPEASRLPAASEACFSLREHLDRIESRIAALEKTEASTDIGREALNFITGQLAPKWRQWAEKAIKHAQIQTDHVLPRDKRCVSPSDFGFHNALFGNDGRLRFIDFEYAGFDDPAKMVCDFFCQPAVPVDRSQLDLFISEISEKMALPTLSDRVQLLLPVYQIKWCCIQLNEFLPSGGSRRVFSNPSENQTERKTKQLAKAMRSLQEVQV
ncbi:MAG: aminoglycoside phosphotransferase family protein [Methylacidiphilales bacterium]|nr:aminoglycoside phosphotransferase family protein [Candidatus Methylacidiphilales bacterium]